MRKSKPLTRIELVTSRSLKNQVFHGTLFYVPSERSTTEPQGHA